MNATRQPQASASWDIAPLAIRPATAASALRATNRLAGEVCGLLHAAGPLTIRDIAGGLAISVADAAARVRLMRARGDLREDEFGRYRPCIERAA